MKLLLMGNEAIARGALEAGVQVATSYPGTPASEILRALAQNNGQVGVYTEWSVNEKVAVEIAAGAAYAGARALTAMKQMGLNVASDAVMSLAYIGVKGGLVLVVADDPGPHSSQTEQDTRGCYTLGALPPLNALNTCLCMGASLGLAQGLKRVEREKKVVTFIGDSTFFRAGLTALINASGYKCDIVIAILDNGTTAMTGH